MLYPYLNQRFVIVTGHCDDEPKPDVTALCADNEDIDRIMYNNMQTTRRMYINAAINAAINVELSTTLS